MSNRRRSTVLGLLLLLALAGTAAAGGGAENVLLIIDPESPESRYLGNYYKDARGIPDRNVIYLPPAAASYDDHLALQQPAFLGMLENRVIADHIDFVVVPPGSGFFISAAGFVSDGCFPVTRFALPTPYTITRISDQVVAGVGSTLRNHYYRGSNDSYAFDAGTEWYFGFPSDNPNARRYFLGAQLGYDGERGNTLDETIAMIDRSVAADGTHPVGTFYYMETTDQARSGPRHDFYPAMVAAIEALGGSAEHLMAVLPVGNQDCLGIMTGWAGPDIDNADLTLLPGSIADHLTSFAATFDTASQTKMSRWIVKGASGTAGTVQEPCNYPGKFMHARTYLHYFNGLSLGEAIFRAHEFVPFQTLIYGDPLTRPFAFIPDVDVPDAPVGPVTGSVTITPTATTSHPSAGIAELELFVDGVIIAAALSGESFTFDTTELADGEHELRVVAREDSVVATVGSWIGSFESANAGKGASLTVDAASGDLSTPFTFDAEGLGGVVTELRLVSNARVLAAAAASPASWTLLGDDLGGGPVTVRVEVEFEDGSRAHSAPLAVAVAFESAPAGDPGAAAPVAYDYAKDVATGEPILVELPATDADGSVLTWTVVQAPADAAIAGTGPVRLVTPPADPCGTDTLTFRVDDGVAESNIATVTLRYGVPFLRGDVDDDGSVELADAISLLAYLFTSGTPPVVLESGDVDGNGSLALGDAIYLLAYLFQMGDAPPPPFPDPGCV